MRTIGFATIAEAPRDDVVPATRSMLPRGMRAVERGNLNGLSDPEIAALAPEAGEAGISARLRSGDDLATATE